MSSSKAPEARKKRVQVTAPPTGVAKFAVGPASSATTQVIAEKTGTVSWLDRAKAYYHTAIVVLGMAATLTPAVLAVAGVIPGPVGIGIAVAAGAITPILTALKSNETWFNSL